MVSDLVKFNFQGDELDVCPRDGTVLVSVRRVCEALGVDYPSQFTKLRSNPAATVVLIPMVAADGKEREALCIDLRSMPLNDATRAKLIAYQRECADVLADHFLGKRGAPPAPPPAHSAAEYIGAFERHLAAIATRLDAIEQRGVGVVGPAVAGHIKLTLMKIAGILHRAGQAKSVVSARTRLDNRLRGAVGWAGTGACWERLPTTKHGEALRVLDSEQRVAEGIAEALNRSRQLNLKIVK